ncbi:MAG: DUF507 family protein [Thermoanaerobaculia bacterium]|nr:DUF507 family protein [Thermoanaerobaculia bacterium]
MAAPDARLAACAAFVARRLLDSGLVKAKSPADVRRVVEGALVFDRDRERQLEADVEKLLRDHGAARLGADVDYSEMFRKAKRLLAEKKKIPL